jgi:hypothetical protein
MRRLTMTQTKTRVKSQAKWYQSLGNDLFEDRGEVLPVQLYFNLRIEDLWQPYLNRRPKFLQNLAH